LICQRRKSKRQAQAIYINIGQYGGKIMKRIAIVVICLLIVFALVACNKSVPGESNNSVRQQVETQEAANKAIVSKNTGKVFAGSGVVEDEPAKKKGENNNSSPNKNNSSPAKANQADLQAVSNKSPVNKGQKSNTKPETPRSDSSRNTKAFQNVSAFPEGYRDVCFDGISYIAVGTGGRIDRIMPDKTVVSLSSPTRASLNGIIYVNGINVAVGEDGIILVSKDGSEFNVVKSGVDAILYDIALFRGAFWISGSGGVLLRSSDGEHWSLIQTETENGIISISANNRMCMAVTREGQILMSTNGRNWNILDYNEVYKGYDEPYWFHSIRALGDTFFLTGEYQRDSGIPIIMSSANGEVWRPYPLTEVNGEPVDNFLPLTVNVVGLSEDQLLVACNDGKLLTLTECIVCHKLTRLSDHNINEMALADGKVVVVGDDFWFDILNNEELYQYNIKPEQALNDFLNGAYIVDVRTAEEYAVSHIKGCIHIPLDQIDNALEIIIPDKSQKIIFYCAKGVRSQEALKKALQLGYKKVYNLGSINDWPYEKVSGSEGSYSSLKN